MKWADGKIRCCWANPRNERYIRYHDEECSDSAKPSPKANALTDYVFVASYIR